MQKLEAEKTTSHGRTASSVTCVGVSPEDRDLLRSEALEHLLGRSPLPKYLSVMKELRQSGYQEPFMLTVEDSPITYRVTRRGRQTWEFLEAPGGNAATIYFLNKGGTVRDLANLTLIGKPL